MKKTFNRRRLAVQNNVPILAADGASVVSRANTIVRDFHRGNKIVKDYDLSFTVNNEDMFKVATIRLNESAAQSLYEELEQKLNETKTDNQ